METCLKGIWYHDVEDAATQKRRRSGGMIMAGSNGFDPAREWLGIAAVDLADPFRALGISPVAADAAAATAAAERLLGRLRAIDPGPFRLAHESLHRRIEACRAEALAAIAARPPVVPSVPFAPRQEFGHHFAPPPVPPPPSGPATAGDGGGPETVIRLRRPVRRRTSSGAATPAILSAVLAAAAVAGVYAIWQQAGTGGIRLSTPIAAAFPRPTPRAEAPVATPSARPIDPVPAALPPSTPAQPAPSPAPPAAVAESPAQPTQSPAEPATPVAPSEPMPVPAPPQDSAPAPAPPQPTPEQRARRAAEADTALREAHAALQRGEFDTADRRIAAADRLADDDEQLVDRVTCWKQLALYAREFPDYRNKALLAAGGDYDVGRTRISVIESTPDVFKYKSAGTIKRIPPADVPRPIVNAIVRTWFAANDQPGNHVFLGCNLVLLAEPDVAGARREWDIAKRGGQNVAFLEPLLGDPIIRDAARQ